MKKLLILSLLALFALSVSPKPAHAAPDCNTTTPPIDWSGCDKSGANMAGLALAAGPIHVTTTGGGNGSSWASPTTLQNALGTATSGDEIWVAAGVYTPGTIESDTFTLPPGVQLYGGFAGNEADRADRNYTTNLTILSGDIGGDDTTTNGVVITTTDVVGSNAYHVLYLNGTGGTIITESTVVDGFTITAGVANGGSLPDSYGGGLYCNGGGDGNECSPTISNVTFSGNWAFYGGAMFNNGRTGNSSPSLTDVTFSGNRANNNGGALYNNGASNGTSHPSLTNVRFSGNSAQDGGAIYNDGEIGASSPNLSNVAFSANSATRDGGAIYNNGLNGGNSNPSLTNVTFSGNSANFGGGAMYNTGFEGNSRPSLSNVILWGNTANSSVGSQMYNIAASPVITTSLVQGGWDGSGIYNDNSTVVTNGGGNINADPLFVDAATGDLRLQNNSPAIDAGTNSAISLLTDLDGNPRFYDDTGVADSGVGTAPIVDMGAFEKQNDSVYKVYLPAIIKNN